MTATVNPPITDSPPAPATADPALGTETPVNAAQQETAGTSPPASTPRATSPPVQPSDANTGQTREAQEIPADPRVAALRAMFPDFDDTVLFSVLESVGGDQDRAVDVLLGMSDPEYKAETTQPPGNAPMSQTELDEQFARQLMLQDQQEDREAWQAVHQQPPRHGGYAPYVSGRRSHSPTWSGQQQPQQSQSGGNFNETVTEFQQQFNRIAETGKKSFGTFFNKVKARLNEFDQPSTRPDAGPSSASPPPQNPHVHTESWMQQQQRQGSYFDPNTPAPPPRPTNTSPTPITPPSANIPATTPSTATSAEATIASSPPPRPPSAPIDGGKIGLLPKRPVSLIRPEESNAPQSIQRNDSDDTLEYAENPFEEGTRR